MLRNPPNQCPNTDEVFADNPLPLTWYTLNCELITPMYGGGVESTVVDRHMPIRTSSIRGNLRFWWRLLAKHKWKLNDIATKEKEIWGGMGSGDDDGKAGRVLLKVVNLSKKSVGDNDLIAYDDRSLSGLRYVLFPAYNETDDSKKSHKLLKSDNVKFDLQVAFAPQIANNDVIKNQIIETLQWWANFGGLGFRSRKGLGAICVNACQDFPQICNTLTSDDVQQAGCRLVVRNGNSQTGTQALATGIQKLSEFRQGVGVGRNEPSENSTKPAGRSFWSEPDAIRSITGRHLDLTEENSHNRPTPLVKDHKPTHQAEKMFPRAVFGLPIIYKFMNDEYYDKANPRDKTERKVRISQPDGREPLQTEVSFALGDGRLASPLIIRPRKVGNHYQVMALALPYQDILKQSVVLKGADIARDDENNEIKYPIWEQDKAELIQPIQENGNNPLDAFLNYFAR